MKTKLTLVMEDEVIYSAKKYAKNKEQSLSSLVENYLKAIALGQTNEKSAHRDDKKIKSPIEKYRGIIQLPTDYDYKKDVGHYLLEKYNKLK
jgi:hypothetical protein